MTLIVEDPKAFEEAGTNTPTDKQLREVEASGGTKVIEFGAEGVRVLPTPPDMIEKEVSRRVSSRLEEEGESRMRARLSRLRSGSGVQIERVDVPGDEPLWIRKLDLEGLTRLGLLSSRDRSGTLSLDEEGVFAGLLAATLFVGCVSGETDRTPAFDSWREACDWATETDEKVVEINSRLFEAIVRLNPSILPEAPAMPNSEVDAAPLAQAPESLAPPITPPSSGSGATKSTGAP